MRYSVISKGITLAELKAAVERYGGRNLKVASHSAQIFCDLDEEGHNRLLSTPGLVVKEVGTVKHQEIRRPYQPLQEVSAQQPIYGASQMALSSFIYNLRDSTSPPAVGQGWTIAILDSGIRKTHRGLAGKVVHEINFTSSPTESDVFSHGTAAAFVAAGGRHMPGEEYGLAPGANLMNIKVLGDDGVGSVEDAILGIEHVVELARDAMAAGKHPSDPMWPQMMNLSWGTEDDGDPDNPLRAAVEAAWETPIGIYAAAGNSGPNRQTIMLPASSPKVWAVGAMTFSPFNVWSASSRGPTREGLVKPDVSFLGVDVVTAAARDDLGFEVKSGTSFAAPGIAGGACIFMQVMHAYGLITEEQLYAGYEPADMLPLLTFMSRKPEGYPAEKDNDTGVGMPFGDLILRVVRSGVNPASGILEATVPLMGIGMLGMMMGGMAKALK